MFDEAYEAGIEEALEKIAAKDPKLAKGIYSKLKGHAVKAKDSVKNFYGDKGIRASVAKKNPGPGMFSRKATKATHAKKVEKSVRNQKILRRGGTAVGVGSASAGSYAAMRDRDSEA